MLALAPRTLASDLPLVLSIVSLSLAAISILVSIGLAYWQYYRRAKVEFIRPPFVGITSYEDNTVIFVVPILVYNS